ncbi:hypothetical protein [Mesorhizobium sp. 10J20-29]
MKVAALALLTGLLFMAIVLLVLRSQQAEREIGRTHTDETALMIDGKLDIRAPDDFRVAGRKIMLCGVGFSAPVALRDFARDAMRRSFQGVQVTCRNVGQGTPCDGRTAAKFGGSPVVQCLTEQGVDIARELSLRGLLCDRTNQSGGVYKAC